eukprot:1080132-Prymnesium_polylepis.1
MEGACRQNGSLSVPRGDASCGLRRRAGAGAAAAHRLLDPPLAWHLRPSQLRANPPACRTYARGVGRGTRRTPSAPRCPARRPGRRQARASAARSAACCTRPPPPMGCFAAMRRHTAATASGCTACAPDRGPATARSAPATAVPRPGIAALAAVSRGRTAAPRRASQQQQDVVSMPRERRRRSSGPSARY